VVDVVQVSLSRGEISPIAADRTDQAIYSNAVATAVNFFIRREGGASNRPGLEYIANAQSNTPNGSYLLPFIYNNQQAYITEFAAGSIAVYEDGVPANLTQTSIVSMALVFLGEFGVNAFSIQTSAPTGVTAGQQVVLSGVSSSGSINPNQAWVVAAVISTTQFFTSAPYGSFTYISAGSVGVPATLSNHYATSDLPNLRWAQSADVLDVVVNTQPLSALTRVEPTSFTFTIPQLLFGPFQDLNTDGTTTVYASATQGSVTLTASSAIFKSAHVGALFTIQEQFLGSILPWVADQTWSTGGAGVATALCRSDGKIYVAVGPPGSGDTNTGSFQPVHTSGTQWDGNVGPTPGVSGFQNGIEWQFVSTNAGVALITQYISPTQVKATVQSYKGVYSNFPPTVVGGPVTSVGPWTFSGTGSQTTFALTSPSNTVLDPNQFYVTVGGIFQDPSTYTISSASGGNIVFYTPPADGTANVSVAQVVGTVNNIYTNLSTGNTPTPLKGLCLSTYWAFGSFSSIQGYPGVVTYYDDRLLLAATQLQPQTFFASQVSDYLNFGVSNPQVDSDSITETLNSRQQNPIVDMIALNQLLLGTATATQLVTNSAADGTITPEDISVVGQEFYGVQNVPIALTGSTAIYVQWGGRKIRDVVYQFLYGKFLGQELTLYAQQMFPVGTTCTRVAYAPEPFGLVFCVRSDGVMCVCTYFQEQQAGMAPGSGVVAWTRYITAGNFEDVCVLPENGTFSVYVIVGRTLQGQYVRQIERFAAREFATPNDEFFVDSGLTYDGRNTSTTTMILTGGTTWLAGDTGTLTASSVSGWANFQATDATLNNAIFLFDASGNRMRAQIISFISMTQVGVSFLDIVPSTLQAKATSVWTFARTMFSGLTNLIGQTVAVQADGAVMPQLVVSSSGTVSLPYAGGVVHAGLPYVSQLQSLNFNIQNQPSIRNVMKTITRASVVVDESLPFFAGPSFDNLTQCSLREFEAYGQPTDLFTGVVPVFMPTQSSDDAVLCIQMSDPAPLTVLGWQAEVDMGEPQ
jgi:hypothetical protein